MQDQGRKAVLAVGLMSGTSLDGVDAAFLRTDGEGIVESGPALTVPYEEGLRARLAGLVAAAPDGGRAVAEAARALTLVHGAAVARLLRKSATDPAEVRVIGFHGHTLVHRPQEGLTVQIGDGDLLAARTGIDVIGDFRGADVAAGGQGAPLAPLYHAARVWAQGLACPLAVLNIGGVANLTWIGEGGGPGMPAGVLAGVLASGAGRLIAFDTGPGNALIDDWVRENTGQAFDRDGALAAGGRVDEAALARLLDDPFFGRAAPKSLDRNDFGGAGVAGLSAADGAATLTAFTAAAVALAVPHLPAPPRRWLVTGGGRRNLALMAALRRCLGAEVAAVEEVGWDGDALEAQAFAYLAVRALKGLALSGPATTGVLRPLCGGRLHRAPGAGETAG